ncbi:MAG: HypC/HybG/HupF family hydrogenase formation chaperone [Nitrospinota bacterium]|nr:HypC/HybG/HupF family hydrogenase formation chaperone [Nitrospinota bacterium]
MCVAVPMKVVEISEYRCVAQIGGVRKEASLMMLDGVRLGDYVMIHAGFAIERVDPKAAEETIRLMRDILDSEEPGA